MNVDVKEISVPYEFRTPSGHSLFRMEEGRLSYEQFTGEMGPEVTCVNFERGDGVGVLPYIEETGELVLIEQFRYPVYAGRATPEGNKGWLIEIVEAPPSSETV